MSTPTRPRASHSCDHCDSSVPHEHLDVRAVVDGARSRARRTAVTQAVLAGLALLLTAALSAWGRSWEPVAAAGLAASGWVVVTVLALLLTGALRPRRGDRAALVGGVLWAAGTVPLVALGVVVAFSGSPTTALGAVAGWLTCTAAAESVRARTWRRLLLQQGDAGERARAQAVADRSPHHLGRELVSWAAPALVLGAAVLLVSALPVLVVVLVPSAVALAAVRVRSTLSAD